MLDFLAIYKLFPFGQDDLSLLSRDAILIIEGKVIEKTSFEEDDRFYTKNELEVFKVFKGDRDETISVLTFGGTVNGITKTYSHSIMLNKSSKGIFFLTQSVMNPELYVISSFIPFIASSKNELYGSGQDIIYKNIKNDLYDKLSTYLGTPEIVKLNEYESKLLERQISISGDDCVEYSIKNLGISQIQNITTGSSYSVEFDIDIRSLNEAFGLSRSELTMEYSTELFGENIVSQNNAIVTLGGDFSNYSFSLSDVANNKAKVDIGKIYGEVAEEINTYHRKLYHAVIGIENFDLNNVLNLAVDEIFDLKTFKEVGSSQVQIDCNIYNEDISVPINQLQTPHIDSDLTTATVTAGTKTQLKIVGQNLWRDGSEWTTEVHFVNGFGLFSGLVKPRSGEYITKESDLIELYVSSHMVDLDGNVNGAEYPGSGDIQVIHKNTITGVVEESNKVNLKVEYALQNKYYKSEGGIIYTQPVVLSSPSGTGSILVKYDDDFLQAKDINGVYYKYAFERALSTWCKATGLNYIVDQNAIDPDMIIGFKPLGTIKFAATGVHSYLKDDAGFSIQCSVEIDNASPSTWDVGLITKPITLDFNSNKQSTADAQSLIQFVPPSGKYSVEQVALHELGHAHGLRHVLNDADLMNPLLQFSSFDVSSFAAEASSFIQNHTLKCELSDYQKQTSCTVGVPDINSNRLIDSYYLSGDFFISTEYAEQINQVLIFSSVGRKVFGAKWNGWNKHSFHIKLVPGLYIISVVTDSGLFSKKVIVEK